MKDNRIGFETFQEGFTGKNTFIVDQTSTLRSVASLQLAKLDASGKTVLITDPYLFPKQADATYPNDLIYLLKELSASKIIYCADPKSNRVLYNRVVSELHASGTSLIFTTALSECHDRFWYCPETEKCVILGTSLNGIGKKICRVDTLNDTEVLELKQLFVEAGVIVGGVVNES